MLQANSCFYQWNPVCQDRLKGRLDIATPCANGDYDTSPLFKAYLCPPVLPPTNVYVPLPPPPTIRDVDTGDTREIDYDYSNILIIVCIIVAGYFIIKRLK